MAKGLCKCGKVARPNQRTCLDCHRLLNRKYRKEQSDRREAEAKRKWAEVAEKAQAV